MPRFSKARKMLVDSAMKESIFEAATSVLSEHGIDGTTMNRVAEAAELAKSSLYDYFPSKDELLEFVFDRLVIPLMQAISEILRADLPAPEKLERVLRVALERGVRHKAILRLLIHSDQEYRVRERVRPHILDAFTTIFEQGIKEGSFRPHNSAYTGRMFLGSLRELYELLASSASEDAVNEYVGALIDVALHGVSIQAEESRAAGEANPRLPNP